jgi:hypothetical protein
MKMFHILLVTALLSSCTTLYYNAWEKLGKEKRELLRDNVADAKDDQQEVSGEFKDALERLKAVYGLKGGDLENAYDDVKDSYEDAKGKAADLQKRIVRVETIGTDLFKEWDSEIDQMENAEYKRKSRDKLQATEKRFKVLLASLQKSEKATQPVLRKLNDQVLFLKHNLNSQALGSLKGEMIKIEKDFENLQQEMNKSIQESENFIKTFETNETAV